MLNLPQRHRIVSFLVAATVGLVAVLTSIQVSASVPVFGFRVAHVLPHDPTAFTEGLFYLNGYFYESTGLEGQSEIRKVDPATGAVVRKRDIDHTLFGEGIVAWGEELIELTWRSQVGFTYDLSTFKPRRTFHYPGEGWALTQDGVHLIMSDGTPRIRLLDPRTLRQVGAINVTVDGCPLRNINELEWVKGEIYANIWLTNYIARIDPATGRVKGLIDLTGLSPVNRPDSDNAVLNGIAYDRARDRLFVTGKLWPKLYEIQLTETGRTVSAGPCRR